MFDTAFWKELVEDSSTPKLRVELHSHRHTTGEQRVIAEIKSLVNSYCVSREGFLSSMKEWLENTSMGNNANFWIWYRLEIQTDGSIQIWHCNANGDPDRVVCTVWPIKKEVSSD